METALHTYSDGSTLVKTTIQQILKIPVWKGNRILIREHVRNIASQVGGNLRLLDSGYHCIVYPEVDAVGNRIDQRYLVDGQHRAEVIREYLSACHGLMEDITGTRSVQTAQSALSFDFPCTMRVIVVGSETEAIEYFNTLNNAQPIRFDADPNLAVNATILALEKEFNTTKKNLAIRQTKTKRPYLHVNDLRAVLLPFADKLTRTRIPEFVKAVRAWNEAECATRKADTVGEKCHTLKFFLAYYPDLRWVRECLSQGAVL